MKLAIIGSGPLAIICAQYFDDLGAEVTLFQKDALGGNLRFIKNYFPEMEIIFQNEKRSIESVWDEFFVSSINSIEEKKLTKAGEVLRVHKRFLGQNEKIANKSRLHDLFRVIYSVNPKEAILKQFQENPEMFKKLGESVINSLHLPVESFEDFDLVIEARGFGKPYLGMGPSNAPALNENNIKESSELFYGNDIFSKFSFENKKNIVVAGHTEFSVMTLLKSKDWLFSNPSHILTWVTSDSVLTEFSNAWLNSELKSLIALSKQIFDSEKIEFEKRMHEWRDLEDYVKAKIPMPIEPEEKLKIYEGYNITSIDRLLDREGLFVTIESPDFRNNSFVKNDLKTIPTQAILVSTGVDSTHSVGVGLQNEEPGFYRLDALNLDEGLAQIKLIEQKILAFFSRAP